MQQSTQQQIRKLTDEILLNISDSYDSETLNKINNLLQKINSLYSPKSPS